MADMEIPLIGPRYTAKADRSLGDIWRHFTTRGHKGPIQCIDASALADYIVTGGVDYTVRCWRYDVRYEAYDLVAMTQMEVPAELRSGEGFDLYKVLKEAVLPTKVKWDEVLKEKPRGVTAVVCNCSPDPGCKKLLRNAPMVSGNAHGDFYVTDLTRTSDDAVPPVLFKLHSDQINDIISVVDRDCDTTLIFMTASQDKTARIVRMECELVPEPEFNVHESTDFEGIDLALDVLFKGGGGRIEARRIRNEDEKKQNKEQGIDEDAEFKNLRCKSLAADEVICYPQCSLFRDLLPGVCCALEYQGRAKDETLDVDQDGNSPTFPVQGGQT